MHDHAAARCLENEGQPATHLARCVGQDRLAAVRTADAQVALRQGGVGRVGAHATWFAMPMKANPVLSKTGT